jgi:hypothetical protein
VGVVDLSAIEARLDAATPGGWTFWEWDMSVWQSSSKRYVAGIETYTHGTPSITKGDGEFIAHAPEDIRALLALVKLQQKKLDTVAKIASRLGTGETADDLHFALDISE